MNKAIISLLCALVLSNSLQAQESTNKTPTQYSIHYGSQVNQLLTRVNPLEMWKNLTVLTAYPDRSAFHDSGIQAAGWLKDQIELMVKASGRNDVSVFQVTTRGMQYGEVVEYKQPSLVLKIGTSTEPGIVIGAHMDTVACMDEGCIQDPEGFVYGADDDGSGTVAVMEAARTLLSSGMQFKKPVYFIWYAAEEMDRFGSMAVVEYFKQKNIPVEAVMQFDMIGVQQNNDPTLWMGNSHTDQGLTAFSMSLAETYLKVPARITNLSDESDHWSWQEAGFKTVFPRESNCHVGPECPRIEHTSRDTVDKLSLSHMTNFVKLAIAFAVELAEPESQR